MPDIIFIFILYVHVVTLPKQTEIKVVGLNEYGGGQRGAQGVGGET